MTKKLHSPVFMKTYIEETYHFDYSNENIQKILKDLKAGEQLSDKDFAIKAYLFVRDHWQYYPYRISLINEDWKASEIITHKEGHCIDKVIILVSILRAANIPARLGLAKVKNHIAVDQIVKKLGSDVLVPHGYIEIFLNGKWLKATPAFNKELCQILKVNALEFDGENDSIFQEFDKSGNHSFMEYLEDYGTFNEVPLSFMFELIKKHYPKINEKDIKLGVVLNLLSI